MPVKISVIRIPLIAACV